MKKLLLFDIDKTLIANSKGHKAAFSAAFKDVYSKDASIDIINQHGMTDQQIIVEVLKRNGMDESAIMMRMRECMSSMSNFFMEFEKNDETTVLDGARELLEELEKHGMILGLVTGNIETIAFEKLRRAGLGGYFKLGGFGSDDMIRANMVRIAVKKAEEKFGFIEDENVFLFGDTPLDIEAGKKAGVITVGVATGIYSRRQLEDSGADFVVDSLADKDKILKILSV